MRLVLLCLAALAAACATPRAATRGDDGPVTLDPIEPVAAYLADGRARPGGGEPARIRVEVVEIVVSPTRPDGGQWDGGRLPDDAAQTRLTEALAAPDAARGVPRLLEGLSGRASAPDLVGEIVLGGARVALAPTPDTVVRAGAALDPVDVTPDLALTIHLDDQDDAARPLVGEVTIQRDQLLDALHAGAAAILDLRGAGNGGILFVTLRVTPA